MYFDTIVGNNLVKKILEEISPNIIYNRSIIIDANGHFHEDYWIIKPNIIDTPIDLYESDYRIDNVIDKSDPFFDKYRFTKIKSKKIQNTIFIEKYIKEIVINEEILKEFKKSNIKGLSFLNIEIFSTHKKYQNNNDIIDI